MAKGKNTPKTLDLASLSQEELLALATELQASNETLTAEKTGLETKVSELNQLIEQLSVANETKTISNGNILTVDGKSYEVIVPQFYLGRRLITVEEFSVDSELLKQALELKCIKEVELN